MAPCAWRRAEGTVDRAQGRGGRRSLSGAISSIAWASRMSSSLSPPASCVDRITSTQFSTWEVLRISSRSSTSTQPCSSCSAVCRCAPTSLSTILTSVSSGSDIMPERLPPSLAEIETLAERALGTIPRQLKRQLGRVVIRVEEFPDEETEAAMALEGPFDILGLYKGVALPHKSVSDPRPNLDMIFLYRRPILDYWCESGEDLGHLVRHVLIHEIGHHFGFSDEDMERIESSV